MQDQGSSLVHRKQPGWKEIEFWLANGHPFTAVFTDRAAWVEMSKQTANVIGRPNYTLNTNSVQRFLFMRNNMEVSMDLQIRPFPDNALFKPPFIMEQRVLPFISIRTAMKVADRTIRRWEQKGCRVWRHNRPDPAFKFGHLVLLQVAGLFPEFRKIVLLREHGLWICIASGIWRLSFADWPRSSD